MNTQEKINLTENCSAVCFIKDSGLFCRLYNQSAYIVTQLLKRSLKLQVKQIKKLDNQYVISCGLPIKSVLTYFPHVNKTDWGYQLNGEFDTQAYPKWRTEQILLAENKIKQQNIALIPEDVISQTHFNLLNLSQTFRLTSHQIAYLINRPITKYPSYTDNQFLNELRRCLIGNSIEQQNE